MSEEKLTLTFCCEKMKEANRKGLIDYSPEHLTTIDIANTEDAFGMAYPIHYCPFCGTKLEGTEKSIKRIEKVKEDWEKGGLI